MGTSLLGEQVGKPPPKEEVLITGNSFVLLHTFISSSLSLIASACVGDLEKYMSQAFEQCLRAQLLTGSSCVWE